MAVSSQAHSWNLTMEASAEYQLQTTRLLERNQGLLWSSLDSMCSIRGHGNFGVYGRQRVGRGHTCIKESNRHEHMYNTVLRVVVINHRDHFGLVQEGKMILVLGGPHSSHGISRGASPCVCCLCCIQYFVNTRWCTNKFVCMGWNTPASKSA